MNTIETTKLFIRVTQVNKDTAETLMSALLLIENEIAEKDKLITDMERETIKADLRITDLERTISNFITHVEEFDGSYQPEELKKLRDLIAVERPYYSPVSYHDDWTGKEVTTKE